MKRYATTSTWSTPAAAPAGGGRAILGRVPNVDLPLDQLRAYRPDLREPEGLEAFWRATLEEAAAHPLDARFTAYDSRLRTVEVHDVSFRGFAGQPVAAWLILPVTRPGEPLPCVVEYVGYGRGRALPHEKLDWSALGFAHLVMDSRGQGSESSVGVTPDHDVIGAPPHVPGFLTLGLPDAERSYYRRLMTDAVRAVDAARAHPAVDGTRVVVRGHSQGGGLALSTAALRSWLLDDPPAAVLADVPFLCDYRRGAQVAVEGPYQELVTWCQVHRDLADAAFAALAHVDAAVLVAHAQAPALLSAALRDGVCPPSTVFAAHQRYAGRADLRVYEWNEHEGGGAHHLLEQVAWLEQVVGITA